MYEDKMNNTKKEKKQRGKRFFHKPLKNQKETYVNQEKDIKEETREISAKEVTKETQKDKDERVMTFKTDWVAVLVKFGILLLVVFFLIFAITKISQWANHNTFTNNMEKMKEVAYVYYKVDTNRPAAANDEVEMTLGDMIDAGLITELKEGSNTCSKDYSYVSLTKNDDVNYDMKVYLSCGGTAKDATYPVTYTTENTSTVTLYELKRTTTSKTSYTCPDGYQLAGKYCVKDGGYVTTPATPKYHVTPARETAARYKASGYTYQYATPIVTTNDESYKCSSGYTLDGTNCIKVINPY